MVQLTGQLARPFRRAVAQASAGEPVRVPAVRREMDAAETGELLISPGLIRWQRHGRPAIALNRPYRLDRVDLKGSHRARLHGLTAGIRLVCPDWSPLFLIAPAQLPVIACAAATSRANG